ncbi:MAG: hypothetical protein FWF87_04820 [Synergistaceae bacterium]|nr:hypothetical protein [Synergistaceae bacterium]
MKRIFSVTVILLVLCGAAFSASAEDGYVRLAIKGTNVNLRPQPRAGGSVVAQMNTGDVFFAEKWPITCDDDNSQWYKIVLPATDRGAIKSLRDWDKRFKANVAFVSASFVTISELEAEDMERILKTPTGVRKASSKSNRKSGYAGEYFDWMALHEACIQSIGANLPEIVSNWGEAEIKREAFEFVGEYVIYTSVDQPDFRVTFYENLPNSDGTPNGFPATITYLQTFYTERNGALIGGITIGSDDRNSIKKLCGEPDEKDNDEGVERWNWHSEFNDLWIRFDGNGRVLSIYIQARAAD